MRMSSGLLVLALIFTYFINVPFGYWRAYAKKIHKRLEWILAIHSPVPLIFLARTLANVPLLLIPIFVLTFFLGQYTGGKIHGSINLRLPSTTRCIVHDVRILLSKRKF